MKRAIALLLVLMLPTAALADTKTIVGAVLVGGGGALAGLALTHKPDCPAAYEAQGNKCVFLLDYGTSATKTLPGDASRTPMLWGGAAIVGTGILVWALPGKAKKTVPVVAITPQGVRASKTFRW